MTLPPVSRRDFLGASAGSAALLASGPLFAQADALPSRKVTVGIMGLNRGMEVAAALEKQPGVVIKYVCDVDSKRADAGEGEAGEERHPAAAGDHRFPQDPRRQGSRRALLRGAQPLARPRHDPRRAPPASTSTSRSRAATIPGKASRWSRRPASTTGRCRWASSGGARPASSRRWPSCTTGSSATSTARGAGTTTAGPRSGPASRPTRRRTLDYDLWQGPAPRTPYLDNRIHYNWHWFWHWGNGELGNNGIHALDLCRWGLGVEFPTTVVSSGGRYRFHDDQETPDTHVATFEFPGGKQITWQGLSCNKHPDSIGVRHVLRRQGGARPGHVRRLQDLQRRRQADRGSSGRREGREPLAGDRHVPHRQLRRGDPQRRPLRR